MEQQIKALTQALLGHNETALELLGDDKSSFEIQIAKAQILVNSGKPNEAIEILDRTEQTTPYQKYYVYHVLQKAFLINDERKSAQVCLTEGGKLETGISGTELRECQAVNSLV